MALAAIVAPAALAAPAAIAAPVALAASAAIAALAAKEVPWIKLHMTLIQVISLTGTRRMLMMLMAYKEATCSPKMDLFYLHIFAEPYGFFLQTPPSQFSTLPPQDLKLNSPIGLPWLLLVHCHDSSQTSNHFTYQYF